MHHLLQRLACRELLLKSSYLKPLVLMVFMTLSVSALAGQDRIDAENFSGLDLGRAESLTGLTIHNLVLADGERASLVLSRSEPFAPDAVAYIDGAVQGPLISDRIYFQGTSLSDGHAQVSLSIGSDGSLRGVLADGRGHWRLLSQRGRIDAALVSDEAVPGSREHDHFQCGLNSEIRQRSREAQRLFDLERPPVQWIARNADQRYRVRVAYDTTTRFMDLFNSDQAAIDYLGDLTNYISLVYVRELNTEIVVSSVTPRSAGDNPWNPDANNLLEQFETFWNNPANTVDQTRTLAHLVDAGPSQGVAYVSALCGDGFDYGVSQGLGTEFDPNADPQGWSFTVVAHELGHNFGSDHTHCYDPVIDECHNGEAAFGCWGGAESLPGPGDQAPGTIMSYCHLLPGGLSNLSVTLGRDHGFGVEPERVPDTMRTHVLARAATGVARCPQPVTAQTTYTLNVNSTGATGVAINANNATYAGTTNYSRANIPSGTSITLTAPESAGGATFSNWTGCGSTSVRDCTISMSQNRTVTVNYSGPALTLGAALDNTELTWTTGGSAQWVPQTGQWQFGGSAAESGTITNDQSSWIETTVTGPGALSYYWRVSSEGGFDFLSFHVDGNLEPGQISGEQDWSLREREIPAGTHTLRWEYAKDESLAAGADRGWLDQVIFQSTSVQTHQLTVNAAGANGVAITANPVEYEGTTDYSITNIPSGTGITLTAPATAGGAPFSNWSGCTSTSGLDCTVSMTQSLDVTVRYGIFSDGFESTTQ